MKLYIDSNIYLDYFRASGESLASLRALKKILKTGKRLELLIPDQTKQEYTKNRTIIVEGTRSLLLQQKKFKFNPVSPLLKESKEVKKISDYLKKAEKVCEGLIEKYDRETESEITESDKLIQEIFDLGIEIKEDHDLLDRAYYRYLKGNPPGKNKNPFGDAVIWESLLKIVGTDELIIVSRDGDFSDEVRGKKVIKNFLRKEWESKSNDKTIRLFISLGEFITSFDKKVKIKEKIIEQEKANSYSINFNDYLGNIRFSTLLNASTSTSSSSFIDSPISKAYLSGVAVPDYLVSLSGISGNGGIKFCPFCGKGITQPIGSTFSSSEESVVGTSGIICSNCGKFFKI